MSYDPNNPKKLTPEEITEMRKYLDELVDGGADAKHLIKSNTYALLQHLDDQQRHITTLEGQLATTKRADDAERERDAALAALRDIDWKSGVCISCGAMINTHAPSCVLAACLK